MAEPRERAGRAVTQGAPPQAAVRPEGASSPAPGPLRILIVDDEPALLRALGIDLRARGFEVATAADASAALAETARRPPDAVLLDLGLPDLCGIGVIKAIRAMTGAPVIVLSGRAESADKISALEAGANDYVTKPFAMPELLARLRAALHASDDGAAAVLIGQYLIDLAGRRVVRATADDAAPPDEIHLTRSEWRLLDLLLRSPGTLVSSARLLAQIRAGGQEGTTAALRFHMAGLRRKLEDDPHRPRHLLTEPGMGYRYLP